MIKYIKLFLIFSIPMLLFSKNVFEKKQSEPLTTKISSTDPEWINSVKDAQKTFNIFLTLYKKYNKKDGVYFFIKVPLKYKTKTSHFWYIYKGNKNNKYLGRYFELPKELMQYKDIAVSKKDIEDWMINDHGYLYGGYSLRLQRSRLPKKEQESFDKYVGVKVYIDNSQLKQFKNK